MSDYKVLNAEIDHVKNLQEFTKSMCQGANIAFPNLDASKSTRYLMKMIQVPI